MAFNNIKDSSSHSSLYFSDDSQSTTEDGKILFYNKNDATPYQRFEIGSFCLTWNGIIGNSTSEFFYPVEGEGNENVYKSTNGSILKYDPLEDCAYVNGDYMEIEYLDEDENSEYDDFIPYYDEDDCIWSNEKIYFYNGEHYIANDGDVIKTYYSQDEIILFGNLVYKYLKDGTGYLYSHEI